MDDGMAQPECGVESEVMLMINSYNKLHTDKSFHPLTVCITFHAVSQQTRSCSRRMFCPQTLASTQVGVVFHPVKFSFGFEKDSLTDAGFALRLSASIDRRGIRTHHLQLRRLTLYPNELVCPKRHKT